MIEPVQLEPIQLDEEYLAAFWQDSIPSCLKGMAEAILDQALRDIINDEGREAAVCWISIDNFTYLFSFRFICELLGMNPYAIRNVVRRFMKKCKNTEKYQDRVGDD